MYDEEQAVARLIEMDLYPQCDAASDMCQLQQGDLLALLILGATIHQHESVTENLL
jgi:hypothetical protein